MDWRQAFPDAKGTIQKITASGNTVTAEILWEGTHKGPLASLAGAIPATGKRVQMRAVQVATVQGGKLKQTNHYFDLMTMLQQIGATPQQAAATTQQVRLQRSAREPLHRRRPRPSRLQPRRSSSSEPLHRKGLRELKGKDAGQPLATLLTRC
jgi:hypothetical protein